MYEEPQNDFSQVIDILSAERYYANVPSQVKAYLADSVLALQQTPDTTCTHNDEDGSNTFIVEAGRVKIVGGTNKYGKPFKEITIIPASEEIINSTDESKLPKLFLKFNPETGIIHNFKLQRPLNKVEGIIAVNEHIKFGPKGEAKGHIKLIHGDADPMHDSFCIINYKGRRAEATFFSKEKDADYGRTRYKTDYALDRKSIKKGDTTEDILFQLINSKNRMFSTSHYREESNPLPFVSHFKSKSISVECTFHELRDEMTLPLSDEDIRMHLNDLTIDFGDFFTDSLDGKIVMNLTDSQAIIRPAVRLGNLDTYFIEINNPPSNLDYPLKAILIITSDLRIIQAAVLRLNPLGEF